MTEWHPDPDELLALAAAELDASGQERLVSHLASCPACRDDYTALSDGLQQALAATPAIAPPPGFSGRVLAAMAGAPVTPRRTGLVLAVAAAILLGLLAGIGGTLGFTAWRGQPSAAPIEAPVAAVRLLTASGESVGSVGLARRSGQSYLLLNVTDGRPGASYECVLVAADGTRTSGGNWELDSRYGSDTASGAWLVPLDGAPPAGVELVAPSGKVWARGTF